MDESNSTNNAVDDLRPESVSRSETQPVPEAQPQPVPQPGSVQQPQAPQNQSEMPNLETGPKRREKNGKTLKIVIISIVAAVLVAIIAIAVVFLVSNSGVNVSMDSVRNYCEKNKMEINTAVTDEEPKIEYLDCVDLGVIDESSFSLDSLSESDYMSIMFGVAGKPFMEYQDFVQARDLLVSSGVVLEESDNLTKIYSTLTEGFATYLIFSGNTYMQLTAASDDAARKALVEMGYPDRNWPNEQDIEKINASQASQSDDVMNEE